jgi:hypothetical protein
MQQSERDEPLFLIPITVVLERERRAGKNLPCIHEVAAVLLKVLQSFRFVPLALNLQIVYTLRLTRNRASLRNGEPPADGTHCASAHRWSG